MWILWKVGLETHEECVAKQGAIMLNQASKTTLLKADTLGKSESETHEECLAKGGATMLNQADKTTPLNAVNVGKSVTIRKSVERR